MPGEVNQKVSRGDAEKYAKKTELFNRKDRREHREQGKEKTRGI